MSVKVEQLDDLATDVVEVIDEVFWWPFGEHGASQRAAIIIGSCCDLRLINQ